jgi:hypothetical protein
MPTIVKPICLAALLLTLGACSKLGLGQDAMTWAREALDRNSRLEVVASDSQAKTFTVRVKDSGQLVVIPLDEVVAGPAALMTAATQQAAVAAPPPPAPAAGAEPAVTPPAPEGRVPASAPPEAAPAPPGGPIPASRPAAPPPPSSSTLVAANDQAAPSGQDTGPHSESATNAKAGRLLASGPGYSIKASGSKAGSSRPSPATAALGAPERLHDPIICQGARLLHIDNRNLEFDGDAITAEDGCEIHITNTHISAKGIGVLARAANVHIKNSEIDGDSGAVDASDGAQVYAESTRFKGLTRRLESSAFHDLGGNVWN